MAKGQKLLPGAVPANRTGDRESAPLKHLRLPDDLFDSRDPVQAAIDAREYNDSAGIWSGPPRRPQISSPYP